MAGSHRRRLGPIETGNSYWKIKPLIGARGGLGGVGLTTMVAGIGSRLISNGGPSFGVDQRRMLSEVELALVGDLTDVKRVRQQVGDMSAREGSAAALDAARRRAALCAEPQAVGLLLDPTHAVELTI